MTATKSCPVILRDRGKIEILAFQHPIAGFQLLKGTIERDEDAAEAAVRELAEEAGIAKAKVLSHLGFWESGYDNQTWSFHLCHVDQEIPNEWIHHTTDDGGHDFRFFWFRLSSPPDSRWHEVFRGALEFIRIKLAIEIKCEAVQRRFVVIGASGSGKSTFAHRLAKMLMCPHVELDSLFWASKWTEVEPQELRRRVQLATSGPCWVADGNYGIVRDIIWPNATDIVWLNFNRFTVLSRIVRRTVWRAITRQELWAGNRERFFTAFFSRKSIVLWSISTFSKNRIQYEQLRLDSQYRHVRWHEFRNAKQAYNFLRALHSELGLD